MEQSISVLVELRVPFGTGLGEVRALAGKISVGNIQWDSQFGPHPMTAPAAHANDLLLAGHETFVMRGQIDPHQIPTLESHPAVLKVWSDPVIQPDANPAREGRQLLLATGGPCGIPPCDCDPGTAKGDLPAVARFMEADQLWAMGYKGQGMVIGIVDTGILAKGRVQNGTVPNVIGGWPENNWGTRTGTSQHGCMTATDALGMAPEAKLLDIRILDTYDTIATAMDAYMWAFQRYKTDRTPQVLSNSWGIKDPTTAWDYCTNPDHPFTRKAIEMVQAGMIIVFSAGNCGATCPDVNCGPYVGPGNDMWGSRGHPLIMAVGAVNTNNQFIGYSSAGPAALSPKKPDFCAASHFKGYFPVDTGTSAACPVAAGVLALLKQAYSQIRPTQLQNALIATARQIGGTSGWNQYTGAGVIRARAAFDYLNAVSEIFAEPEPALHDAVPMEAVLTPAAGQSTGATESVSAAMFVGAGRDGRDGDNGQAPDAPPPPQTQANPGGPGSPGKCASWGSDTKPGQGKPGDPGATGAAGVTGRAAERGDDGGNGSTITIDSRVFKGTISLNFRGGNGGRGGTGGAGGTGQQGQQGGNGGPGGASGGSCQSAGPQGPGANGGKGGDGGIGGRGGNGGNGGDGGHVYLIYDPSQPQPGYQAVPLDGLSSGRGGIGGNGGPGGVGGAGGAGGSGNPGGTAGQSGAECAAGESGMNGVNGAQAVVRLLKSETQ